MKRPPLLTRKQLDCTEGTELHPAYREPQDGRDMDPYAVRDIYETAIAKDAELIQQLVDHISNARNSGCAPFNSINDIALYQALAAANAAGFTPSNP